MLTPGHLAPLLQAEYGTRDSTVNQLVLWDAIVQDKVGGGGCWTRGGLVLWLLWGLPGLALPLLTLWPMHDPLSPPISCL